ARDGASLVRGHPVCPPTSQPKEQSTDPGEPKHPPMMERYLQEKDPYKEFLAKPAEKNQQQNQTDEIQHSDKGATTGDAENEGGERQGMLYVKSPKKNVNEIRMDMKDRIETL
ncbi:MAG: hypothetical protein Q9181_002734, partial [Wetmoreana brouardii]